MQKLLPVLENYYKYLVGLLLLSVILLQKFPLFSVTNTFVSVRLEDFILAAVVLLSLPILYKHRKTYITNKILKYIALYLIIGFVSLISSLFITGTVTVNIGFLHLLRRAEYFSAFIIGLTAMKITVKDINFYFNILIIIVFLVFIYGFGQKYFSWPIIITQNMEYSKGIALRWVPGSHINSTFAGHYDLATFLVLILPMFVVSIFVVKKYVVKLLLAASFFSGLWLLVNSASRISLFSYLVAVIFALLLVKKFKAMVLVTLVSLVFIGFSSNLIARYTRFFEVIKGQVFTIQDKININNLSFDVYAQTDQFGIETRKITLPSPTPIPPIEDRSTSIRLNVEWPRALRAFIKNPLLGTGYSSITLATDNDYLRLLGETGLLGFISFVLIIVNVFLEFVRRLPLQKRFKSVDLFFLTGVFASLFGVLINATFIDVFEASKFAITFWLILGLSIGLLENSLYENDN